uniref:Uncharacterized protein n=1 Tax=viral metagenome TaxID=1070528 RepID=A0A6H1Z751_9ZZZZ
MRNQLDLFSGVEMVEPEPMTEVRLGRHSAKIPLRKMRREACGRLLEILTELEGKAIWVGLYETGGHFFVNNLKLPRLQLEYHPYRANDDSNFIPSVIVLWGSRSAQVRIHTDYLVAVREQEYQGYWLYLLDFRNGFYDSKLDQWHSHYACLQLSIFKD